MKIKTKIKAALRKNIPDLKTFLTGKYPYFVYGKTSPQSSNSIPIFVFHEVEPKDIECKLMYLKENGYRALDCEEWWEGTKNKGSLDPKNIVLTFDDGHISLWKHAYPLLKKFNFKAISFICPGLIPSEKHDNITIEKRLLCSWRQIKIMHDSGYVDFQSHGLRHDLVFISPKLVGFLNPKFSSYFMGKTSILDLLYDEEEISLTILHPYRDNTPQKFLGFPIFDHRPRFNAENRFQPSDKIIRHILNMIHESGGLLFFKVNDWQNKLRKEIANFSKKELGKFIPVGEYQKEIAKDFILSKKLIEEKLSGKKVKHFCAPWFVVTKNAMKTAFENGYLTTFVGEDAYPMDIGSNKSEHVLKVPRLSDKYIYRLPGGRQKKIIEVFLKTDKHN